MNNNTLTNINNLFWNNINYFFHCFKKPDNIIEIHLNDYENENDVNDILLDELEKDSLLGVRHIRMNKK